MSLKTYAKCFYFIFYFILVLISFWLLRYPVDYGKLCAKVLRIRDVYPGSVFFPSRIRIKVLKYFTQKIVSKLSEIRPIRPGLFIPVIFYPSRILDPGVKKAPDPQHWLCVCVCRAWAVASPCWSRAPPTPPSSGPSTPSPPPSTSAQPASQPLRSALIMPSCCLNSVPNL